MSLRHKTADRMSSQCMSCALIKYFAPRFTQHFLSKDTSEFAVFEHYDAELHKNSFHNVSLHPCNIRHWVFMSLQRKILNLLSLGNVHTVSYLFFAFFFSLVSMHCRTTCSMFDGSLISKIWTTKNYNWDSIPKMLSKPQSKLRINWQ